MFNTLAEANEVELSRGSQVLARTHVTFALSLEETETFTQTKGERTTCRKQASVKQTSGRIFIDFFQCCR